MRLLRSRRLSPVNSTLEREFVEPSRSKFITAAAVVFGLLGLQDALGLLSLQSEVPSEFLEPDLLGSFKALAIAGGVLGLVEVASAFGLFFRRRWSRRVFQVAIVSQACLSLALPMFWSAHLGRMAGGASLGSSAVSLTMLFGVVVLLVTAWVAWRLESEAVKHEVAL